MIINRCVRYHSSRDEERLLERRASGRVIATPDLEWKRLLRTNPSERRGQAFLERYPQLLPGLNDLHNGPLHDIIVTKFPLGAEFKTDFAFISRHSMALQFTFIELESPAKRIFNNDGSFSQGFS